MAPAVEPSDVIEDLFDKFNNAAGNARVKVVRLPTVDRSNSKTTLSGLQQAGNISLFLVLNDMH